MAAVNVVFPWSTCPIVPAIRARAALLPTDVGNIFGRKKQKKKTKKVLWYVLTDTARRLWNRRKRFYRDSAEFEVPVVKVRLPAPRRVEGAQRLREHFS